MISIVSDNVSIPVHFTRFSDGASNVKLDWPEGFNPSRYIALSVDPTTPADNVLWEIYLVVSAVVELELEGSDNVDRTLILNYLPHGRADRVFEKGNANPLKTFACAVLDFFDEIFVKDVHNRDALIDLGFALKLKELAQDHCFVETFQRNRIKLKDLDVVLVSPDAGAVTKTEDIHIEIYLHGGKSEVLQCSKVRDKSNGRIIETTVPDVDLTGKHIIICDDILDGGGTFIPLAEKLRERGAAKIDLYVTHGIFAKGVDIFGNILDNIYVNQIVGKHITMQDIHNFNEKKEIYV